MTEVSPNETVKDEEVFVTESNVSKIYTYLTDECIVRLPSEDTIYHSVVYTCFGDHNENDSVEISKNHSATTGSTNSHRKLLSELFMILWDVILSLPESTFKMVSSKQHTLPPAPPPPSSSSSSSTITTPQSTTALISSVIQQYNSHIKVGSMISSSNDTSQQLQPPVVATVALSTPPPKYRANETISSYMHRILHDHILQKILIPVLQRINNSDVSNQDSPEQRRFLVSTFLHTIASSVNYQLISSSSLLSMVTTTAAANNKDQSNETYNRKEWVRLIRNLIRYIETHPLLLSPISSATTATAHINILSEAFLKYCTNISFLYDIGIMTTTGSSSSPTNDEKDDDLEAKKLVDQLVSKRLRMINTALHYRQYKFNLFVEESEGYAKFLSYVTSSSSMSLSSLLLPPQYDELYSTIHSMIGTFYLDPNRCLDMAIDLLEYECFVLHDPPGLEPFVFPAQTSVPVVSNGLEQQHQQHRLLMYIYVISILNSTTKLPQLIGYKLKCRRMRSHNMNHSTISISSFDAATTTSNSHPNAPPKTTTHHSNDPNETNVSCDTLSLLHCTAWLCLQPQYMPNSIGVSTSATSTSEIIAVQDNATPPSLLDPVIMLSYLPDDVSVNKANTTGSRSTTSSYEEILEFVYDRHVSAEKARIRNVGRASLTSNNVPEETTDATVSSTNNSPHYTLSTIEVHCITQWITIFVQHHQFTNAIQNLLTPSHWSMLSVLLPHTIGIAILDQLQTRVNSWLAALNTCPTGTAATVPWSSSDNSVGSNTATVVPSIEDVIGEIFDPLMFTMESGCISLRPTLYCQLCRLLTLLIIRRKQDQASAKDSDEDVVMSDSGQVNEDAAAARIDDLSTELFNFLKSYLVPCLSSFHSNPAISMELWNVIQALPYSTRYSLYASWRGAGIEQRSLLVSTEVRVSKPLWLIEGELRTGKDIRYALKRISKDTIRDMSRSVAKCCHGHPLVVFTTILNQIESYDNLVQVMVDACRFVTPLSLDVLGYCILQRLSDSSDATSESRSRLKANGVNVSQWLQSLETFTGAFYKRFPFVEFQGLLYYLLQRLKDGHVMELGVLRTLLKNGAGWSFADYSPAESLSMTQLEGRAGSTRLKRETMTFGVVSDINLSASNEVRRVLHNNSIGVSLLILLAQVRHSIIFQKAQRSIPVKLIGNLVDTSQVVMSILLDFLTNEVDHDGAEIGHNSTAIHEYAASLPTLVELQNQYKVEVASSWTLCRPLMRAARSVQDSDIKLNKHHSSSISRTSLRAMASKSVWKYLTTELFEFFYSISAYDIFCPGNVYENEILRLEKETERLSRKKNTPPPMSIQPGATPEKSDREEYERVKQMVIGLNEDYAVQKKHVASIHETMLAKIPTFFVSEIVTVPSAVAFFTRCVYPRCMQGPDDAMFCAHFVSLLHQHKTPGFGTLHFFDALVQILPRSLYCLTESEAACASILLSDMWKTISKWRYDDAAFESELMDTPGSFIVTDGTLDPTSVTKKEYENLYNKWHAAIGDTLVGCLQSKEYMHLRCGLIVLTRIVDEFPTRPKLANTLLETLEPLKDESNTFADIRASSQAYSMQLLRSRDNGVWKEEDAATVQARLALVEAAAMERQRKAQEQMEQIERDSEKITSKIGISETRGRGSRGSTLMRSNSDERLNRSNVTTSDANRRRAATSSGPIDDGFRAGGGSASTNSGGGSGGGGGGGSGTYSFSSYASIAPVPQVGESLTSLAGRTLEGRWQHATSGTTPPRNPGSNVAASTSTNVASSSKNSGIATGSSNTSTNNTRKRGRVSSSPTNPSTAEQQQPHAEELTSSSTKRAKVSQPESEIKRSRTRHNTGSRRS